MFRIYKAVVNNEMCRADKVRVCQDNMVFQVKHNNILYRNSFLPIVSIDFSSKEMMTGVNIYFEIKNTTKAFIKIYLILLMLYETVLVEFAFTGKLDTFALLMIPPSMALFSVLLCYFSFKFSCKEVLCIISDAIESEKIRNCSLN